MINIIFPIDLLRMLEDNLIEENLMIMSGEIEAEPVQLEAEQSPVLHMNALQRAHELPLVKSATTCVNTFYKQAKGYSPLVNSTLNIAEKGAELALLAVTPVVIQYDNIQKVDEIACRALNALETRYPSVRMETEEVSARILNAGVEARDGLLESRGGQRALLGLAEYLRIANEVADATLPEDKSVSDRSFQISNLALLNVAVLSDKLYCRIYRLSTVQLRRLRQVSTKALAVIQHQLIVILKYIGYLMARQILSVLVSIYTAAADSVEDLPADVQLVLQTYKPHAHKLYMQLSRVKTMADLKSLVFCQFTGTMNLLKNFVSDLLKCYLQPAGNPTGNQLQIDNGSM